MVLSVPGTDRRSTATTWPSDKQGKLCSPPAPFSECPGHGSDVSHIGDRPDRGSFHALISYATCRPDDRLRGIILPLSPRASPVRDAREIRLPVRRMITPRKKKKKKKKRIKSQEPDCSDTFAILNGSATMRDLARSIRAVSLRYISRLTRSRPAICT